jgi:hypothetical protein
LTGKYYQPDPLDARTGQWLPNWWLHAYFGPLLLLLLCRGGQGSMDISADLTELGRTPVAVVCAGAKSVRDNGVVCHLISSGCGVYNRWHLFIGNHGSLHKPSIRAVNLSVMSLLAVSLMYRHLTRNSHPELASRLRCWTSHAPLSTWKRRACVWQPTVRTSSLPSSPATAAARRPVGSTARSSEWHRHTQLGAPLTVCPA